MASIQINGVGFTTDAVLKQFRTVEEFSGWNFFDHCWLHLKKEDKQKAIEEAWQVINEVEGVFKKEQDGNDNTNSKQPNNAGTGAPRDSRRKRRGDKGGLPESASGTSGGGVDEGSGTNNP